MTPDPKLLSQNRQVTEGVRVSGPQHPVQHRYAHGRLRLLGGKAAASQPWSNRRWLLLGSGVVELGPRRGTEDGWCEDGSESS